MKNYAETVIILIIILMTILIIILIIIHMCMHNIHVFIIRIYMYICISILYIPFFKRRPKNTARSSVGLRSVGLSVGLRTPIWKYV